MNRDSLYRECAHQSGLVQTGGHQEGYQDVDRVVGGAWVECQVYISNAEVGELLSHERRERRLEGQHADDLAELHGHARELADTPRRGDV